MIWSQLRQGETTSSEPTVAEITDERPQFEQDWQAGSEFRTIFSFENGEVAEIISFYSYDGCFPSSPKEEFRINDEIVSEAVYNAEFEAYPFECQDDFIIRKYDTTESTIENVLREY